MAHFVFKKSFFYSNSSELWLTSFVSSSMVGTENLFELFSIFNSEAQYTFNVIHWLACKHVKKRIIIIENQRCWISFWDLNEKIHPSSLTNSLVYSVFIGLLRFKCGNRTFLSHHAVTNCRFVWKTCTNNVNFRNAVICMLI